MLTLGPDAPPMITPGKAETPPGMMAVPRFDFDADAFERVAAKHAFGEAAKNLAVHLTKSKRALDERLAELEPMQLAVHEARVVREQAEAALNQDIEAHRTSWIETTVANEQCETELTLREASLATREAAVEAHELELKQQERELAVEETALAGQQKQHAAELAAFEIKAGPVRRKLEHLRQLAEIGEQELGQPEADRDGAAIE
jgi:hypothetical protein